MYQKELICVRCGSKGTIKKIKLHNIFERGDEVIYFVCVKCKTYGSMWESIASNAEDFFIMLDEEWEWAPEDLLKEKISEEDLIDTTKSGEELEKELAKIPDENLRKRVKDELGIK